MDGFWGVIIEYFIYGVIILIALGFVAWFLSLVIEPIAEIIVAVIAFKRWVVRTFDHLFYEYEDEDKYQDRKTSQTATLPAVIEMTYRDDNGDITNRTITLQKIKNNNGKTYLHAHCHLRNEQRIFISSRIIGDIVNQETGEVDTFENMFS